MKCIIITIFPEYFQQFKEIGVVGRAIKKKIIDLIFINPRKFSSNLYKSIDDRAFGGIAGMIMTPEPIAISIEEAKKELPKAKVIYLTPKGELFQQKMATKISKNIKSIILLCGRYAGIDQRVLDTHVDEEISLGKFIVSGGEIPAMMFLDAIIRLLPNTLNNKKSILENSFAKKNVISFPCYTRPRIWRGKKVPDILFSGNHKKIKIWKKNKLTKKNYHLKK